MTPTTIYSKTFWFGIGTLIVSMLSAASSNNLVQENPNIASGIGVVVMIITFVLGIFTPQPKSK